MKKDYIKLLMLFILSVVSSLLGVFLIYKSKFNYDEDIINYNEKSRIDYKVYLKGNPFFDEEYLSPGGPYITTLIDYIDIDYNYNILVDSKRSGKYKYYIKGIISASIFNTDSNYWEKSFELTKPKEEEFNNKNVIDIKDNVKIEYEKFNDILLEFKKEFGLSIDGKLKVIMYIDVDYKSNINDDNLNKTSNISLDIPLTKATIEVPIEINNVNKSDKLTSKVISKHNSFYIIIKLLGYLFIFFSLINLVLVIYIYIIIYKSKSKYQVKLNRILKTYDGFIVTIKSLPNLDKYSIIDVHSFEELLDAHSEVRHPINYYQEGNKAIFILIGSVVWRYVLEDTGGDKSFEKKY